MKKIVQNTLLAAVAVLTASSCRHQDTPTEMAPATQRTIVQDATAICADTCPWTDSTIAVTKLTSEPIGRVVGSKHVTTDGTDTITSENVALLIDSGAVSNDVEISIVATTAEHSGVIPAHMENLTANGAVYRMLPDGQRFEKDITIAMRYDSTALPYGYTPDDIYTFFYNEQTRMWQQVARDSVDTKNQIVYSRTNHFTDYINGVLKVPENSDAMAYTPTTIKDLKAADPMEGITLIAPPEANNMGTAKLTYPLSIPTGRHGMQPQLAVTYNSAEGNGILGLGWSLPLSEICVETRWGVPLYDTNYETESYLLDGTTLVTSFTENGVLRLKKPVYHRSYESRHSNDTLRFYPRVEGAFRKIERIGTNTDNYHWMITDKDGTRHYYGLSEQSKLRDARRNIAKWMIEKSVDTYGNTVNYIYVTKSVDIIGKPSAKQLCIDRIRYTGVDGTADMGQYFIRFSYVDKPDKTNSFRYGLEEINNYLLNHIEVLFRDTIVREYYFGYRQGAFGKTLLCKIFESYDDSTRFQLYESDNQINTLRNHSPFCRCDIQPISTSDSVYLHLFHAFDYHQIGKPLFLEGVPLRHKGNDNLSVFENYDSVQLERNCLNGYGSIGWNVYGGLNVGSDDIPWLKTFSVGGHYSYSEDYADGFMQLVDINGDGYPDKLYKSLNGTLLCRPQIPDSNMFGEPIIIENVDKFQYTSNSTQNYGWEASALVAGVGKSWSDGRSSTSVYVSDVNGDGLVDIVNNGSIYINRGNYQFSDVTNNDTIQIGNTCLGDAIEFSGEVDTTIFDDGYYTVERIECQVKHKEVPIRDTVYNEDGSFDVITQNGMVLINQDSCWTVIDTIYYSYPKRYEPDIDLVRMWKAPYDGEISVNGTAKLTDELCNFRARTRTNDGVWISIQRAGETSPRIDSIVQPGDIKKMSCLINVLKGDTIFFRINAKDKRLYDQVEWIPRIKYISATHSNNILFSSARVDVNGDSIYRFDYKTDYMLAGNQSVAIGPSNLGTSCSNTFNVVCKIKSSHILSQDMLYSLIAVNIDNSGTDSIINERLFNKGTAPDTTISWTASSISSHRKLILRLSPVGDGQLKWSEIETDATVTLTHSSDSTINSHLADTNASKAYIYHPVVERVFYDYLAFPSSMIYGISGSPFLRFTITTDNTPFNDSIFFTIKNYNNNVCFKKKIKITGGSALVGVNTFSFDANVTYSIDCYIADPSLASHITSIKVRFNGGSEYNVGLYAKYSPEREKHHGILYRGWGQFGYKSPDSTFRYIRRDLIHADNYYAGGNNVPHPSESYISNYDVSFLDADSDPEDNPSGSIFNPLSGTFFEMHADAEKKRWTSFSNLVSASDSLSSLDNTNPATENGETATVDMFQSPLPVPNSTSGYKLKAINKMSMNKGNGYTIVTLSKGEGYSRLLGDFMDLNGDRYPDNISEKAIQYSRAQGGLGSIVHGYSDTINHNTPYGINRTINSSIGYANNGTFLNLILENVPNAKKSRSISTVSGLFQLIAGSSSRCTDSTQNTFMDINGDGLADIVYSDSIVRYNMGYGFSSPRIIPIGKIHGSFSEAEAHGFGFNIGNTSIAGGISRNTADNRTSYSLMDVNGDGLPDKIANGNVQFNTGNGFTSSQEFIGVDKSSSTTFSLNVSVTCDYILFPFLKIGGSAGGGGSASYNHTEGEYIDMNNDGYIDYVYRDGENIMVCYSNIGRANLLSTVSNFAGAEFHIDYKLDSATVRCPQRHWNMSSLTIFDGHRGDGSDTIFKRFSYGNRVYDRFERDDYGYDRVNTYDYESQAFFNAAPPIHIYRTATQEYHNGNYYLAHLKKRECVSQGNEYVETEYTYADASLRDGHFFNGTASVRCEGDGWPAISTEESHHSDGSGRTITTKKEYLYGEFGNVISVEDYGDMGDVSDDYSVKMDYDHNLARYIVANVSNLDISGYRLRYASYTDEGSIEMITLENSPSPHSTYMFSYDAYGNISRIYTPAQNLSTNDNYWIHYFYDTLTHTLPVVTANAEDHVSYTNYSYRWQKPVRTIDICDNLMQYTYDSHGHLNTIIAPKELSNGIPYTVKYDYWYNRKYPVLNSAHYDPDTWTLYYSWARTRNYDPANPSNDINTVTFCDGLGRVIQIKKDIDEEGSEMRVVGGIVHYDIFGRKEKEYFPVCESLTLADSILSMANPDTHFTATYYDFLDRPIHVIFPDNTSIDNSYFIAPDSNSIYRFCNAFTDQNGNTTYTYTDPRQLKIQFTDALNNTTIFNYDAVGQLTSAEDPEGNLTTFVYDLGGRRTSRYHPSSGYTRWDYDAAGNMIKQTQNSGEYIEYFYNYSRPVHISYSNRPWNDVWYEYGLPRSGNQSGRLVRQQDASGVQRFEYDNMGNIVYNAHTYIQPYSTNLFTLETNWEYDTWGRVLSITYPDQEIVNYSYDHSGNVNHIEGSKINQPPTVYVDVIHYDRFGQRTYQLNGDGVETRYQYNVASRRLSALSDSSTFTQQILQKNTYKYDDVGNITDINDIGLNHRDQLYEYDNINRLVYSEGSVYNLSTRYEASYQYSAAGRILKKHVGSWRMGPTMNVYQVDYRNSYSYSPSGNTFAINTILDPSSGSLNTLEWDANGNLIHSTCNVPAYDRRLCWTEDNRLQGFTENSYANGDISAWYNYDAGGNRNLKITSPILHIRQNGTGSRYSLYLKYPTLYASALITLTSNGYTKHYFEGTNRICSKIGGGFSSVNWNQITTRVPYLAETYNNQILNQETSILYTFTECLEAGVNLGAYVDLYEVISHEHECNAREPAFYYHSDHLGSTAYLTNDSGQVSQVLNYLPYGEDWVEIHNITTFDTTRLGMYRFNGKEKDYESGFHYYGARYYWSEILTGWLSVDPMADKYPNISPYAYCAWNPVKLVDPDGRENKFDPESEGIIAEFRKNTESAMGNAQTMEQRNELQTALDELDELSTSDQMYHIEYGNTSSYNRKGETDYDIENDKVRIIIAFDGRDGDIAHELKHAYQFETGDLSFDSRTGGCPTAVLYDITDEEAAYRRGTAYGKEIPKNLEWHEKFSYTNSITGEKGLFYPFLQNEKVKLPDIGAGRNFPASSKDIHGRNTSVNNIYRYGGTTYKK